mmetsp:Transcript_36998/g.116290  ORF Transcript_36998/g.116290 Transcript_36998/m.116290 type:complete len:204 (-) Transcript_36998:200-811(-)
MTFTCSASEVPWKRGSPRCNHSARMQPIDHMSTALPYRRSPSSTSGARYQSDCTSGVHGCAPGSPLARRESPKSHSLSTPFRSRRRLVCLRSRWRVKVAWTAARAERSCMQRHFACASANGVFMCSMSRPRSYSTSSITRNICCWSSTTSCTRTTFGWRSESRMDISRTISRGTPSSTSTPLLGSSCIALRATSSPLSRCRAL